jgi:hypothetical protein
MILSPTHREIRPGAFRAVIRLDQTLYDLAGVYSSAREAQAVAEARAKVIAKEVRTLVRPTSVSSFATRAGLCSKVTP